MIEAAVAPNIHAAATPSATLAPWQTAFLFDLDGTLVDSSYQHVLAWLEALTNVGIKLSVWTIHRRMGMSGGLMANQILHATSGPTRPSSPGTWWRMPNPIPICSWRRPNFWGRRSPIAWWSAIVCGTSWQPAGQGP
jgi:hypothetical protein